MSTTCFIPHIEIWLQTGIRYKTCFLLFSSLHLNSSVYLYGIYSFMFFKTRNSLVVEEFISSNRTFEKDPLENMETVSVLIDWRESKNKKSLTSLSFDKRTVDSTFSHHLLLCNTCCTYTHVYFEYGQFSNLFFCLFLRNQLLQHSDKENGLFHYCCKCINRSKPCHSEMSFCWNMVNGLIDILRPVCVYGASTIAISAVRIYSTNAIKHFDAYSSN